MNREDRTLYWVWLSERCGAASRDFGALMHQIRDPFELYCMREEEIEQLEAIGPRLREKLCNKSLEEPYRILALCETQGIRIFGFGQEGYPSKLRTLVDPPVVLYVKGELPAVDQQLCIGMVGTRNISEYGQKMAYKISYELAAAGVVIVSGMAIGVDGVSACGALSAGGRTVAVLGSGVSVIYPKSHARLYREILKSGGAVVSEYSPLTEPARYTFPKRNRIISGLCQGVVIVEGSQRSGSLITAEYTIDQGRDLFALPGEIGNKNAEGPNYLIREGAYAALGSEDILKHYDFLYRDQLNPLEAIPARCGDLPALQAALARYGVAGVEGKSRPVSTVTREPVEPAPARTASERKAPTQAPAPTAAPQKEDLPDGLDPLQRQVLSLIPREGGVSQEVLSDSGLSAADLSLALMMLEMAGLCEVLPGGLFRRK